MSSLTRRPGESSLGSLRVTSGPRLADHRADGYGIVVRLMTGLPGDAALAIEEAVRAALRLAGITPIRGREYYDAAALAVVLDVVDNYPLPSGKGS